MDHWFYTNYADTSTYSVWQNGLKFLVDKIDPKYIRLQSGQPTGLVSNHSVFYYIGTSDTSTVPQNIPAFNNNGHKYFDTYVDKPRDWECLAVKDRKIKKLII
jgi:hypothetical protein